MIYYNDQNVKFDIKEFGFDLEIIKKQNESYKTEDEKREHLRRVYKKISGIFDDLRLINRYLDIVDNEFRKIKGGINIKINKKDLLKKISELDKDEITARDFEEILNSLLEGKRKEIRPIYNNAISRLYDKFIGKDNDVFILEILNQIQALRSEIENKPTMIKRNLNLIKKEFSVLREWVIKEYAKYDYLKSFITEEEKIENDITTNKKLKKFKRGELKKELTKSVKELKLQQGVSVESKIILKITNQLIKKGWAANSNSVGVVLRNMGYVESQWI